MALTDEGQQVEKDAVSLNFLQQVFAHIFGQLRFTKDRAEIEKDA
jgi:hypothetical protein